MDEVGSLLLLSLEWCHYTASQKGASYTLHNIAPFSAYESLAMASLFQGAVMSSNRQATVCPVAKGCW